MKTKPISLRFDENDLLLAINKSGIKKTQKLVDFLLGEYVRDLKPQYLSLPKDFIDAKIISAIGKTGKVVIRDITSPPKETNYTIDTTTEKQINELEEKIKLVPQGQYYNKVVKSYKDQIYRLKNSLK